MWLFGSVPAAGYRPPLSVWQGTLSLFQLHNESGNVWSHLLPGLLFTFLAVHHCRVGSSLWPAPSRSLLISIVYNPEGVFFRQFMLHAVWVLRSQHFANHGWKNYGNDLTLQLFLVFPEPGQSGHTNYVTGTNAFQQEVRTPLRAGRGRGTWVLRWVVLANPGTKSHWGQKIASFRENFACLCQLRPKTDPLSKSGVQLLAGTGVDQTMHDHDLARFLDSATAVPS